MGSDQSIQHFSTGPVPAGMRFDYWMSVLRQSLWPVSEWKVVNDFSVELREAHFGCLTSMTETIGPSQAHRTRSDVERSGDRCFMLFANELPWKVDHNGHNESYGPGDSVLVDSQGELKTCAPSGFRGVILKLPVAWINTWLPSPELLVGQRIAADSRWGRVFAPIVRQLTPELVTAPPVPHGVIVDQFGAVLAMVAAGSESCALPKTLRKIQDCIRQRCSEPQLTVADVAASLDVPTRDLHRILAVNKMTFAGELLATRVALAVQMLTSPLCNRLTDDEIARRSGFLSVSQFTRAITVRTGGQPAQLRQSMH
jgi:AraC-like DNA-binding protein